MPFYEYECPSCRYYLEVMQKISDPPLGKCPSCGKRGFKRLISAPVFRLKGSGWYETDFKSDKENKRNLVGEDREPAKPAEETKADKSAAATGAATAADKPKDKPASDSKPAARRAASRPRAKSAAKRAPARRPK